MRWIQLGKRFFGLYKEEGIELLGAVEMEKYTCRWGGFITEKGWPGELAFFNSKREAMDHVEKNVRGLH